MIRTTSIPATLRRLAVAWLGTMALLHGTGCAGPGNPYFDATRPHHTRDGFKNNYTDLVDKPFGDLLRWRWEAMRDALPKAPAQPTPVQAPDLVAIHANAAADAGMRPAITWIGHATMLVQAGGLNVLTDPIFSERASPVQFIGPLRTQPPGVAMKDLPPIDVVLITHNHYDHLDCDSVLALNQRAAGATVFLVPLGLKPWLKRLGISNAIELDWWDKAMLGRDATGRLTRVVDGERALSVAFYLTPVQHWSARGLSDRRKTLWGGWAVFSADFHWYYSGDTGYSPDFADTARHFAAQNAGGFDLALLPIGAYAPRWFMKEQHVNPAEAVQIHRDLGAKRSVGVHWGTFNLTDESLDQPVIDLAAALRDASVTDADFFLMRIGETRRLPPR